MTIFCLFSGANFREGTKKNGVFSWLFLSFSQTSGFGDHPRFLKAFLLFPPGSVSKVTLGPFMPKTKEKRFDLRPAEVRWKNTGMDRVQRRGHLWVFPGFFWVSLVGRLPKLGVPQFIRPKIFWVEKKTNLLVSGRQIQMFWYLVHLRMEHDPRT